MARCSSCGRDLGSFAFGKKLCRWCVDYEAAKRGERDGKDEIQRVMPTPWKRSEALGGVSFNQLFVGINLLVFMAMVVTGISLMSGPSPQEMIPWGGNFGPLTLGGEPWRIVTYMFLHYGLIHFGFNMWCLWDLGALAESMYGDWTFAIVYLLCGLGGGVASLWWHPNTVSAGASGAIFGLAGALLASLKLGEFSLPKNMLAGVARSVVAFVGYNLVLGAMWGWVDNACHIGGLVTGLILGALIAVVAPDRDGVAKRIAICLLVLLIVAGCGWWVRYSRGFIVVAQYGTDLLARGRTEEGIAELQYAVQMRPDFAQAHFNLAHGYLLKGDAEKGQAELRRVLELNPHSAGASYALGLSYLYGKRLPEAKATFSQMVAENFPSADGHVGLGFVAVAEHNDDAAVKEFETALRIDHYVNPYYDMGAAYARLKRYDEAIPALKKAQELDGDSYDAEMALAYSYRAKGMQQEADEATRKAAELKAQTKAD